MDTEPRFVESELTESPEPPPETIGKICKATKESANLMPPSLASTPLTRTPFLVRSASTRMDRRSHPLEDSKSLLSCIRLLDAKRLSSLPHPLPRAQDLPEEYFCTPTGGDQVISVSHAWRNQAHPDPTSHKTKVLSQLLSKMHSELAGGGDEAKTLLFLDFTSIPQRPFRAGHTPRTDDQVEQFRRALSGMHEMYFLSDRVIHLPWDDHQVAGEGAELLVSRMDLRGACFEQTGSTVQVSALPPKSSLSLTSARGPPRLQLFDQVLAVDNELVTSIEQLESLMNQDAIEVRLRRYPFGVSNTIPADARGWVFLERFITMVKCAMMDEETSQKVVITTSEDIHRQIMEGAARLREASHLDLQHGQSGQDAVELERVLDSFTNEMQCKKFFAASTDKRLLETAAASSSPTESDRDVVSGIMQKFIQHLKQHWEAEAAEQRKLGRRLRGVVAATKTFLTEWDCFSMEYEAKLATASSGPPWPIAVMVLLPPLPTLFVMSLPLAKPDEGWEAQMLFWSLALPAVGTTCCLSLFMTLISMTDMPCTRLLVSGLIIWSCCYAVLFPATSVGIASRLDVFPLPLTLFLGSLIATVLLPALLFCLPAEQRSSKDFWWRAVYSIAGLVTVVGVFGFVFPSLNALIPLVSIGWQALLVSVYLVVKLMFEAFGLKLSRRLGADAMPLFLCWATMCYQFNLCMVLSSVDSWLVVAEQIIFDVVENWYHLWSLRRQKGYRQKQYIVASLVLREFLEVVAPAQFLVIYSLLDAWQVKTSELLCSREKGSVLQTQIFLLVDIGVELGISCFTCILLVHRGCQPIQQFRGLIATHLLTLLAIVTCVVLFYMCMSHSHWGNDTSYRWPWIFEEDVQWLCGLTWATAA